MNLPPMPMGNSRFAFLLRQLYRAVQESQITSISGGEMKRTSRGTQLVIKPGKGGTSTGMAFRGEWKRQAYEKSNVVTIYSGSNAGTYVCVNPTTVDAECDPVPQTDARHGSFWCLLITHDAKGNWF
jgi:hypothetical protein